MPEPEAPLPRRDIILLPLISLLTCVALFALAELGARIGWPGDEVDACVIADPTLGHRFKPNCVSRVKSIEGPWVTNRYNACGYRTDQDCGPRPTGVRRVDLMGSSTSQGYLIPYESTIGATIERSLTAQCHQQVQLENLGMIGYQGELIATQMDEAMVLKPDAIVYLVTPFDFDETEKPNAAGQAQAKPEEHVELLRRVHNFVSASRAIAVAQHFIFENSERFAALYLRYGDRADFLRPPFTPAWRERLAYLDGLLGRMEAKASASGVQLVLAYMPSRVQAIFLSSERWPPNVDPFAFGRALSKIATAHKVAYIDLSELFTHIPDAGSLFYPMDGHLTAEGQPLVGRAIAAEVIASAAPFHECTAPAPAALTAGTSIAKASR
jgi:hypothetical protein